MNIPLLAYIRAPFQYLQNCPSKIRQSWQEKYGPFFKHLQESLAQKCSFKRTATPSTSNPTTDKAEDIATKVLLPEQTTTETQSEAVNTSQFLPLDPKTTYKILDNGFSYYIRDNAYPSKETASFNLVIRAGSTDEQEHERGLAHFLEHMLFQGTENFGKQEIKRFLESKGAAFGADQNAHTKHNETVYKFTIPLQDPELIDKTLYILSEMATKATLSETAIEEERAVILDEILRENSVKRYADKVIDVLLEGTPYPQRNPRGLEKVVRECTPDQIRAFYKRYYFPQNMALVAVGDFDKKQVENLIQKHFGSMTPSNEPAIKHEFKPVKRDEPQYVCHSDPESTFSLLQLYHPLKTEFNNEELTIQHVSQGIINSLYHTVFNRRLREIITDSDSPPFISASGCKDEPVDHVMFYTLTLAANDGEIPNAYKRLLLELKRVQEHGFTPEELELAKKAYRGKLEHLEKEKEHISNGSFVSQYISHFISGNSYVDFAKLLNIKKNILELINLEHINAWSKVLTSDKGTLVSTLLPESLKDTINPEILKKVEEEVALETTEPYVHTVVDRPLLRLTPTPGKIIDTTFYEKVGVTELTLENGMHIYIRPSTQKEDTILIYASTTGGQLSAPYEKLAAAEMAPHVFAKSGQAGLTPSELRKVLAGTTISQKFSISNYLTSGLTTINQKNLETAFQLIYSAYADRTLRLEAFNSIKKEFVDAVKHQENDPEFLLSTTENALCTQNHPYFKPLTAEQIENTEFSDVENFLTSQLQNPGNYNLVITGNVQIDEIKQYAEKYLAGLPGQRTPFDIASFNYPSYEYPSAVITKEVKASLANTCQTHISFPAPSEDTRESRRFANWTSELLSMHLSDRLRFIKAENYSVHCEYAATAIPGQEKSDPSSMELEISGLPENIHEVNEIVLKEIEKLQQEGFSTEEVESFRSQVKEAFRKGIDLDSLWLSMISGAARWGWDINALVEDFNMFIDKFDEKIAQEHLKKLFPLNRYVQVTLLPKETQKE